MAVTEKIFLPIGDPGGPTSGQTQFTFEFPYVTQADVKVSLDGTDTTAYTFANATTIQLNAAPADGVVVRIYRVTDNDNVRAEFYPGSAIRAQDLNNNFEQILYVTQENTRDQTNLETYVDATFVEDIRVHFTGDTWSDTDDYNIPTVQAVSDRLTTLRDSGFWDTRYFTESELLSGIALDNVYVNRNWFRTSIFSFNASDLWFPSTRWIDTYYYTKSELDAGQLDNRYYTEAEADARYWNVDSAEYIDSGDTWTPDDQHIATTAAIEARVVTLVDDVGGFVPIASYTDFPTTNPDPSNNAGTVVSIQNVSGLDVDLFGFSSNATTTAGTAVTIYGFPNNLSFPLADDFGMLVVTTATPNWYSFHRLVAPASDVIDVASNATNINTVAGQISPTNNVATVAGIAGNITTTAGISSSVTAVAGNATNINTVAGISGNVTTVAGISGNVNTVAGNNANVTAVANNAANINTVAGSITNVNNVGGSIANVNIVAPNIADVNTVAADITDVTAVSTNIGAVSAIGADLANSFSNITDYGSLDTLNDPVTSPPGGTSDIQTVATDITDVSTVAGQITPFNNVGAVAVISSQVATVASNVFDVVTVSNNIGSVALIGADLANTGGSSDIQAVAANIANVNTVATNTFYINAVATDATNIGTVAGSIANVNAVGTDIASVNTAAANLAAIIAAPTEATNAANSASAAATSETNAAASESNAATSATAAATSESNAATSASNASTSATNAAASATAAATSATNAASSEALALQYRDDTAGLLTQADSDPYNVSTNQAWGDIIASAFSYFANEVLADTLLTMSKGTNTYDYGTI